MSGKHSLKETQEVLRAVKGLTLDALEALSDGADIGDINVLFKNLDPLKDALDGIDKLDDELEDLDAEEIKTLINEGVDLVFSIVDKVKAIKKTGNA